MPTNASPIRERENLSIYYYFCSRWEIISRNKKFVVGFKWREILDSISIKTRTRSDFSRRSATKYIMSNLGIIWIIWSAVIEPKNHRDPYLLQRISRVRNKRRAITDNLSVTLINFHGDDKELESSLPARSSSSSRWLDPCTWHRIQPRSFFSGGEEGERKLWQRKSDLEREKCGKKFLHFYAGKLDTFNEHKGIELRWPWK